MTTVEEAGTYLLNVGAVTLVQLFALGGPALILILMLSSLSESVEYLASRALGRSTYLMLFGWIGTIVHETGHLLAALLFRHEVKEFHPIRGLVGTKPNYGSLYQYIGMFFIGIAPVVFGVLMIYLALFTLFYNQMNEIWRTLERRSAISDLGIGSVLSSGLAFLGLVFSPRNLLNWRFYVFLYIAFAVGSSISLSREDKAGAKKGCLPLILLLFLFNTVLLSLGSAGSTTFSWLTQYYTFLYILLFFVILLDLLAIAILWLPAYLRSH